jgi:hypothetical protein
VNFRPRRQGRVDAKGTATQTVVVSISCGERQCWCRLRGLLTAARVYTPVMRRFLWLLPLVVVACVWAQQNEAAPPSAQQPQSQANQPHVDYLQKAAGSAVFVFKGDEKPCNRQPLGTHLLPIGSGFIVGLQNKSAHPKPDEWIGLKLLITAGHVLHSRKSIVIRLNRVKEDTGFACFTIPLVREGNDQNVFTLKDEDAADVAGITLPTMPDTDPTVFGASMLLDRKTMDTYHIKVGTNIFAVGYFFGYAGEKANYPITKFGKISLLTPEKWFYNDDWNRYEEGYVVELQNVPGLSGSPVMTYGFEFQAQPFRFRELEPDVIGIVKALEKAPVADGKQYAWISQGVAVVEPAANVKKLVISVLEFLRKKGADLEVN